MKLPPFVGRDDIHHRLRAIFPEGVEQRNYCIREAAASTVFTMLYIGAVQGRDVWTAPKQIVRMTAKQATRSEDAQREAYCVDSLKPGFKPEGVAWYQENSREQIRDETIRQGFIPNNAVVERPGLPTTSSRPRYALQADFAALFDPALDSIAFENAAAVWRGKFLSAEAVARTVLVRRGASTTDDGVLVTFPNGETRRMAPGPSSFISKAVIEVFARRFLTKPAVLWISESGAKIISRDDELAKSLHLKITSDRNLPDIILVDLGSGGSGDFLLVFIEVVATDGPMTAPRKESLLAIATDAGFPPERVAFVTAFVDRADQAFKKAVTTLAWQTFAWFATEPEHILALFDGTGSSLKLKELLRKG